jgi:hypothetical protein
MFDVDLLELVQPASGWFAIVGIGKDGDVRQKLVATREEADEIIEWYGSQKRNVFFGVAKFATSKSRTKDNVAALRAFWLDVDCGPGKGDVDPETGRADGYEDQTTALQELKRFCKVTGLPTPTLVSSGGGVHAYWALDRDVTRAEWEPVAERLRQVCRAQSFHCDDKVFEVARILRVPGTFNYKKDEPRPVQILLARPPVSFDEFRRVLGAPETQATSLEDFVPTPRQEAVHKSLGYSFKRILKRSRDGNGCAQIWDAFVNQETLGYYEWFYGLSVAARCEDAEQAVHIMSRGHPDYDPALVDEKVATIRKATSCATFKAARPELCEGCQFSGKISGPRDLGRELKLAETDVVEPEAGDDEAEVYVRPKIPLPFYWGQGPGVWLKPAKDDVEAEPMWVYEHDLYVVKRMEDSVEGGVIVMRHHLPRDPVKEFSIPLSKVTQKDELRKALSAQNVVATGKRSDMLMEYIVRSVKDLQYRERAEIMRQQFGWVDNGGRFVLGDQEITAGGNIYSPPSKVTQKLSRFIGPVGSFEKWRDVWALYGEEGLEAHAFAALSAFGSPLMKFLNQTGAVINLFNPRSGTGKTTILNMVNSVYGHPRELRMKEIDTINGKLQWVGILNNLPATMDEMTNVEPKQLSDFLYSLSNGKGKERMMAGSNELRENNTTWQNITVSTANSSFAEKLSLLKNLPEGELMRLIEYPVNLVDSIATTDGKEMFDQVLLNNYGHAGPIYLRYVLNNMEEVMNFCNQMQSKIDRELDLLPKERFWSATMAANISGGILAKRCGLISWDMNRIYKKSCELIERLRSEAPAPLNDVEQVMGDYVYRHMQNILVIEGNLDKRTKMQALPLRTPRGELLIRMEPDTKLMFLLARPFKDYCVKFQINYAETVRRLEEKGRLIHKGPKRISKGTEVNGEPVHCLVFKITDDFINTEEYVKAPEDAD